MTAIQQIQAEGEDFDRYVGAVVEHLKEERELRKKFDPELSVMKEMKPLTMGRRFRIWLDGVKWRWRNGGALGVAERRLARRTEQVEVLKKRVKELMTKVEEVWSIKERERFAAATERVRAAEAQAMAEMERSRRVQVEEWLAEKVQIIEWKKDTVERLRSQIEELTRVGGGGEGLGTEDWGLSGGGGGGDR